MYCCKNVTILILILSCLQTWNHATGQEFEDQMLEIFTTINQSVLTNASTPPSHDGKLVNGTRSISQTISNSVHEPEGPIIRNGSFLSTLNQTNQNYFMTTIQMNFHYAHDMFLIPCLSPFGIIGNSIVAYTLKGKPNTANRYMITILLTDVISLILDLFIPLASGLAQSDAWYLKEIAAQMHYYAVDVLGYLCRRFNLNVFCVLSFERLTAATKPFEISQSLTVKKFHLFLTASLLIAIVQSLPTVLFKDQPVYDNSQDYTFFVIVKRYDIPLSESIENLISNVLNIIDGPIQILFFTVINILIVRIMRKRKRSAAVANSTNIDTLNIYQKNLIKMFLVLSVTNALAFLSKACAFIVYTLNEKADDGRVSPYLMFVLFGSNFLRSLNSISDFIVFLAVSTEIRNDTKKMFSCNLQDRAFPVF